MYMKLAFELGQVPLMRKIFNRSLQALPVSQHSLIWKFVSLSEAFSENLLERYMKSKGQLQSHEFNSNQSTYSLIALHYFRSKIARQKLPPSEFVKLCEYFCQQALTSTKVIDVQAVIRAGITNFTNETGHLWNLLAEHFIRLGHFERAQSIYEEALESVCTLRDFTLVFDSLIKVEETIVIAKMRVLSSLPKNEVSLEQGDINLRLFRLEKIIDSRSLKLCDVLLRENPNMVKQWVRKVHLLSCDYNKQLETCQKASRLLEPSQSIGRFSRIWKLWARICENYTGVPEARKVFASSVLIKYKFSDELGEMWRSWIEFELRNGGSLQALHFLRNVIHGESLVFKYDKFLEDSELVGIYLDLEESCGTFATYRAAYEFLFDRKALTVQMVVHYSCYLEENDFFEESFRNYEKGIQLFSYPQVRVLWLVYLEKFVLRYKSNKILRQEDLFEQALSNCPKFYRAEIYLKYVELLVLYGSQKKVVAVLRRAYQDVAIEYQLGFCRFYARKMSVLFGSIALRKVYAEALEILKDDHAMEISLDYFALENDLNEVDRARTILKFAVQFATEKTAPLLWKVWKDFEQDHGSEETYKEMLRIQMSYHASRSQSLSLDLLHGDVDETQLQKKRARELN